MASSLSLLPPTAIARHFDLDANGTGLRVTWREDSESFNLSLWRGDTCIETFLLSDAGADELAAFIDRHRAANSHPEK